MSALRWLARQLGAVAVLAGLRLLPRRQVRGFELYSQVGREPLEWFVKRIANALTIIEATDPRSYRLVGHYVRRFGLVAAGGDHYLQVARAHVISLDWLRSVDDAAIALNMIHEMAHARLAARGVRLTAENVARIERFCVNQEIQFASRLPDAEERVKRLHGVLDRPWWTLQEQRQRLLARLTAAGVPQWLTHIVVFIKMGRMR